MSIATEVHKVLTENNISTFSLYCGYGLKGGERISFPTGIIKKEKRNAAGQVSSSECHYSDGSYIRYTRMADNNFKLKVLGADKS